jgi:hypothetical protein
MGSGQKYRCADSKPELPAPLTATEFCATADSKTEVDRNMKRGPHGVGNSEGVLYDGNVEESTRKAETLESEATDLKQLLATEKSINQGALAEVERLKAQIHQMQNEEIDSMHDIVAEHDGAVAEVESLTALLHKEASAHARMLGKAEKYKRLLEVAIDKIEASEKYNKEKK